MSPALACSLACPLLAVLLVAFELAHRHGVALALTVVAAAASLLAVQQVRWLRWTRPTRLMHLAGCHGYCFAGLLMLALDYQLPLFLAWLVAALLVSSTLQLLWQGSLQRNIVSRHGPSVCLAFLLVLYASRLSAPWLYVALCHLGAPLLGVYLLLSTVESVVRGCFGRPADAPPPA